MEGVVRGEGEEAPKAYSKGVENLQGCLNPHLGKGNRSEESRGLETSSGGGGSWKYASPDPRHIFPSPPGTQNPWGLCFSLLTCSPLTVGQLDSGRTNESGLEPAQHGIKHPCKTVWSLLPTLLTQGNSPLRTLRLLEKTRTAKSITGTHHHPPACHRGWANPAHGSGTQGRW